jgi:hypothetical protein
MPIFVPWMLLALFLYGSCLLIWAGFRQKSRGKFQSARNFFFMGVLLAIGAGFFFVRILVRMNS